MKKIILVLALMSLLTLASCSENSNTELNTTEPTTQTDPQTETTPEKESEVLQDNTLIDTDPQYPQKDFLDDLTENSTITKSNNGEILITKSGTYTFSGDYQNTSIIVNVDKDADDGVVYLVLDNATISSNTSTPINIIEAKDVVIYVKDKTENSITQGNISTNDVDFPNSAIYSKADTAIVGSGTLNVTTTYKDGINSRDDLIIEDVTLTVNASSDGIIGKDLLAFDNAHITVIAEKDGLKSSNDEEADKGNLIINSGTFDISAENDGINCANVLKINDGTFRVISGGGYTQVLSTPSSGAVGQDMSTPPPPMNGHEEESTDVSVESKKGIKATNLVLINGGVFELSCYEDAIHSNDNVNITNGDFKILSGDDAIHADNVLDISDGNFVVVNCFEALEGTSVLVSGGDFDLIAVDDGINCGDTNGGITISGGNIYINFGYGGDGIDSNGDFTQTGGDVVITCDYPTDDRNAPLDAEGTITLSGGTMTDGDGNDIEIVSQSQMQPGQRPPR